PRVAALRRRVVVRSLMISLLGTPQRILETGSGVLGVPLPLPSPRFDRIKRHGTRRRDAARLLHRGRSGGGPQGLGQEEAGAGSGGGAGRPATGAPEFARPAPR